MQVITLLRTPISPEDIKILVKALDKKYKFIGAKPYKKSKMLHAFGNYQVLLMENVKDTRLIYVNKEVSTFFKDMLSYGEVRKVEEDDI